MQLKSWIDLPVPQIKHVWRHLTEWVNEHHRELEILTSKDDMIKEHMIKALQEG